MHERTKATIDELRRAVWFSRIGIADAKEPSVLSSWAEAIDSCRSAVWQELLLEASNRYREQLARRSKDRWAMWNLVARELKEITGPLVREKTALVEEQYELPKVFGDTVRWTILGACMEAEYADVYPPGFYASMAYWYVNGHFPCGWRGGRFPAGRLLIF